MTHEHPQPPLKKLTLLAAFGGGYVLGAKAGRERYEQIRQTANQVKEDPRVQDVVTRAEDILRDTGLKHDDDQTGSHRLDADEVVYSAGPDIEETIDELIDLESFDRPVDERDNR